MTKVTQNKRITHTNFLKKQFLWSTLIFYYNYVRGLNMNVAHIDYHYEN